MERNRTPKGATNDVDTVLDIVSNKDIVVSFTSTLKVLWFEPETYASGGTTIETPAGRRVLDHPEEIIVCINNFTAISNRSHLLSGHR